VRRGRACWQGRPQPVHAEGIVMPRAVPPRSQVPAERQRSGSERSCGPAAVRQACQCACQAAARLCGQSADCMWQPSAPGITSATASRLRGAPRGAKFTESSQSCERPLGPVGEAGACECAVSQLETKAKWMSSSGPPDGKLGRAKKWPSEGFAAAEGGACSSFFSKLWRSTTKRAQTN